MPLVVNVRLAAPAPPCVPFALKRAIAAGPVIVSIDSSAGIRQTADALLPPRRTEQTDIVLCWDLINYLNQPALTAVMECIALRCKRGALAHGLVYYSAKSMPQRPSTFIPVDDHHIIQHLNPGIERPAPRYSPEDLARCMPRYSVERGRLLRNGMQEFLFKL